MTGDGRVVKVIGGKATRQAREGADDGKDLTAACCSHPLGEPGRPRTEEPGLRTHRATGENGRRTWAIVVVEGIPGPGNLRCAIRRSHAVGQASAARIPLGPGVVANKLE